MKIAATTNIKKGKTASYGTVDSTAVVKDVSSPLKKSVSVVSGGGQQRRGKIAAGVAGAFLFLFGCTVRSNNLSEEGIGGNSNGSNAMVMKNSPKLPSALLTKMGLLMEEDSEVGSGITYHANGNECPASNHIVSYIEHYSDQCLQYSFHTEEEMNAFSKYLVGTEEKSCEDLCYAKFTSNQPVDEINLPPEYDGLCYLNFFAFSGCKPDPDCWKKGHFVSHIDEDWEVCGEFYFSTEEEKEEYYNLHSGSATKESCVELGYSVLVDENPDEGSLVKGSCYIKWFSTHQLE